MTVTEMLDILDADLARCETGENEYWSASEYRAMREILADAREELDV